MTYHRVLTVASVLTVLLMTVHLADDIVRGMEKGGPPNLLAVPILVTWLYAALFLAERRSGYVILLLGSLLGAFVPVIHFRAPGGVAGGGIASSTGALFWVWTLVTLGVTSVLAFILAARALWESFRRGTDRQVA